MKNLLLYLLLFSGCAFAQESGNVNYASGNVNYPQYPTGPQAKTFDLQMTRSNELVIEVNGMSNIKADAYVAIFHITQVGKSTEEVNDLLNEKIEKVKTGIKAKDATAEIFVDMLSFVPMYEYELEKKLFSKNTYNEIPKGFELKKNIHIKYTNSEMLSDFISICTQSEIYDLVRVDYICNDLEKTKRELAAKAVEILKEKVGRFEGLLDVSFEELYKQMIEGYQVHYPIEQYQSYQAFSSSSLDLKKTANVNNAAKSRTSYYNSVPNKEFDFVVNPVVLAPVVQVLYQVKLRIVNPPKPPEPIAKTEKEYLLLTTNGDLKKLQIGN